MDRVVESAVRYQRLGYIYLLCGAILSSHFYMNYWCETNEIDTNTVGRPTCISSLILRSVYFVGRTSVLMLSTPL